MNKMNILVLQQQFLQDLERGGKSLNTLKNYKTDLDCFNHFLSPVENSLNQLTFQDFVPKKVMEYDEYLHQRYQSSNSRRRRVQALRLFFDYLIRRQVFAENPVKKIPPSPKFLDIPRPTPFGQIEKIWLHLFREEQSAAPFTSLLSLRNQIILMLIYEGGAKVSDLALLQRDHIFVGETPRVLMTPRKRDPYSVPLSSTFSFVFSHYEQALQKYKENHKDHHDHQLDFSELLFNANPFRILSGGLSPRGLEMIFAEFRQKLKIQMTPKSLRQSCIYRWIHQGKNGALIKEWLGVAPSYSLKIYEDHMDQHIFKDADLLYPPKEAYSS